MHLLVLRGAQPASLVGGVVLLGGIAAWYALRPLDPTNPAIGGFYALMGRYDVLATWVVAAIALLAGIERTAADAANPWLHPLVARQDVRLTYVIASASADALVLSAFLAIGLGVQIILGVELTAKAHTIIGAALLRSYAAALLGCVLTLMIRSRALVLVLLVAWAVIPIAALLSILMSQQNAVVPESLRTLLRWSPVALVFEGPARFRVSATFAVVLTVVTILIAPFTVARKS